MTQKIFALLYGLIESILHQNTTFVQSSERGLFLLQSIHICIEEFLQVYNHCSNVVIKSFEVLLVSKFGKFNTSTSQPPHKCVCVFWSWGVVVHKKLMHTSTSTSKLPQCLRSGGSREHGARGSRMYTALPPS